MMLASPICLIIFCLKQKDVNFKRANSSRSNEEPYLEFSRRDRAGKRHWVADSRRDCDKEDPHGDRYLVINLQVALWRSKAFRGDIGYDSRVRVF